MAGSEAEKEIIVGGYQQPCKTSYRYEYTSSTQEQVPGRIAVAGSSASQAKLATNATVMPVGVFLIQTTYVPLVSGKRDSSYCESTHPCDIAEWGVFRFKGTLISGQTVVKGQPLMATTLGKLTQWNGLGYACAIAAAACDASSADAVVEAYWIATLFPRSVIVTETVTVSTTGATTRSPVDAILDAQCIYAATLAAGAAMHAVSNAAAVATGAFLIVYSSGVITPLAADGVTSMQVRYLCHKLAT